MNSVILSEAKNPFCVPRPKQEGSSRGKHAVSSLKSPRGFAAVNAPPQRRGRYRRGRRPRRTAFFWLPLKGKAFQRPLVPRPKQEGVIKGETRCFPLEIASRLCRGKRASAEARAIMRGSSREAGDEAAVRWPPGKTPHSPRQAAPPSSQGEGFSASPPTYVLPSTRQMA